MKPNKLYRTVPVTGEGGRLPNEEGFYIAKNKQTNFPDTYLFDESSKIYWIRRMEFWYEETTIPTDEEVREPIQDALFATRQFLEVECTEITNGILEYLNDAGLMIIKK